MYYFMLFLQVPATGITTTTTPLFVPITAAATSIRVRHREMASYWYSTDGMDHKRLSTRHLELLDRAFERRARVEIRDDQAFGIVPAIADPFLGTMTSGDIHYGLYRNPSLRQSESNCSLDTLILVDSTAAILPPSPTNAFQQQSRSRYNSPASVSAGAAAAAGGLNGLDDNFVLVASDRNIIRRPSQQNRSIHVPSSVNNNRRMAEEEECVCCIIS
ncbi:hypothetical protein BDB00DRAFT_786332 [Zychaea mexicana]|uniref:uncharacterized protein n=1 Tax=Zychaea mexicana TaxID=64656 RepID=UPI0022FDD235|nr:uncharacterized protein BDB00DRAFT_786332 [Zychaea mexicana]KAI9495532.1 hypothetical protein BDB00DRAFT_786332 [Zychaea mexicana]